MSNDVSFGLKSAQGMMDGINIGADSVAVTLGYSGRNVFIYKKGFPVESSSDGVTVLTSIRLKDPLADAGLKFIQDISSKTAYEVGDSTTSVVVILRELINEGMKLKQNKVNPIELKKGMERALKVIVDYINANKKSVGKDKKLLMQVATVSAHSDSEIGGFVAGIYDKLGIHASIIVQDAQRAESSVELVNGFQFPDGFFSNHFINTPNNTAELINPYVLIIEGKLEITNHIWPILEKVVGEGRDLVIIAEDFSNDVARDFHNNVKNTKALNGYLIKNSFTGETKDELLIDLCAITPKTGKKIEKIDTSYLGQCEKIVSRKDETTIFNGKNNKQAVALRIDDINKKISKAKNTFIKEKYELRLAKLSGAVAIYYVGGNTQIEVGEKMGRIDDAIRSTRCAIEDGILPGAGTILVRCIENISKLNWKTNDEKAGIALVQKSIEKPLFQICQNAGKSGELMVEKVKEKTGNFGYNAKTDKIEDLVKAGIIDPAKVVRVCIENAVSAAIQFIISECTITEENI